MLSFFLKEKRRLWFEYFGDTEGSIFVDLHAPVSVPGFPLEEVQYSSLHPVLVFEPANWSSDESFCVCAGSLL